MYFLICFDTVLGRKIAISNSRRGKKDSVCRYLRDIFSLIVLKTGQVEFSFNSTTFMGFLMGSIGKCLIFEKSGQIFEQKKETNGFFFIFQRKKLTKNYQKRLSKKNEKWLNHKGIFFLEKSMSYLLDRKKTIFHNKNDT